MVSKAIEGRVILGFPETMEFSWVEKRQKQLDQFLCTVERSAFRIAEIATKNVDDALDIVQDSMIKLVEKYADKPADEWRPLFYSILRSRITDYHRKKTVLNRIFSWVSSDDEDHVEAETEATFHDPLELLTEQLTLEILMAALRALPPRQQEAFLLRIWQGFSVKETGKIMNCAEGSVKTHLFRASEALRLAVGLDLRSKKNA